MFLVKIEFVHSFCSYKLRIYSLSCITKNANDVLCLDLSVDDVFVAQLKSGRKRNLTEHHAGNI